MAIMASAAPGSFEAPSTTTGSTAAFLQPMPKQANNPTATKLAYQAEFFMRSAPESGSFRIFRTIQNGVRSGYLPRHQFPALYPFHELGRPAEIPHHRSAGQIPRRASG